MICPPYTALRTVVEGVSGSAVRVAAQNMHAEDSGAFTGEVSAPMLLELGVSAVVLGHSERRQHFGETDAALAKKVPKALAAGLLPILCVGETEEEREAGETQRKLRQQVQADLAAVGTEQLADVVIAYEPIWAIGTGKTATPEQAQDAIAFVRALVRDRDAGARGARAHPLRRQRERRQRSEPARPARRRRRAGRRRQPRSGRVLGDRVRGSLVNPVPVGGAGDPRRLGDRAAGPGNAVSLADTPVFDELWATYPHTQLEACGPAVGLPEGQMGNSEVGHLNLGAGTVVKQDLARIDEAIDDGSFFENPALRAACAAARDSGGTLHLVGLVSAGGVHSSLKHLRACIELGARERVPAIVLHAFTDGRDTLPTSSPEYFAQAEAWLAEATSAGVPGAHRLGDGPLLGDGPRPALGPHQARVRRARARGGTAGAERGGRREDGVRARRDGRVHPAHDRR